MSARVSDVMKLVDDVERAPTKEHAQAAKTCIAVIVAQLTGEDLQVAFDSVRGPAPIPLAAPAPHRPVKPVMPDVSLSQAVESLVDKLELKKLPEVPWVDVVEVKP